MMNLVAKIRAAGESCGRRDGRLPVCRVKCQRAAAKRSVLMKT